jgi:hypothetical protein
MSRSMLPHLSRRQRTLTAAVHITFREIATGMSWLEHHDVLCGRRSEVWEPTCHH